MIRINFKLISYVIQVNLLAFAAGCGYSWSSPVIPILRNEDPNINPLGRVVTPSEESWIASLITLGATFGPTFSGYFSDKIGRKKTLLMVAVPMFFSNLILMFANTPIEFYVARFMVGLGCGSVLTVIPMFVGEIAETEIRGFLGCFLGLFCASGILFGYSVGPFVSLKLFSFILMIPIVLFIFFFGIFVPESPFYYIAKGDNLAAEISLNKLRMSRNSASKIEELAEIKKMVEESKGNDLSFSKLFKNKSFRKGMIIANAMMVFQQLIGITIVILYLEEIFAASGSSLSSVLSTIIVAFIQVIINVVCSSLMDKWGRRALTIISCTGCALSLSALGIFFYLKAINHNVVPLWWLPISSLIVFIISFNFGMGVLPYVLLSELFSNKTKSLASTICTTVLLSLAFVTTFVFPIVRQAIGLHGVFWFFAISSVNCALFAYFYIPETKGRTFQEILTILGE